MRISSETVRKIRKRILPFVTSLVIVLAVLMAESGTAFASGDFTGGDGSQANPYQIATADQLNNVRNYNSKYFRLTADIDLNVAPYNTGAGWIPINDFYGSFDGNGHTISGVYINGPTTDQVGFFRFNHSIIKNVVMKNINVTGSNLVGGLVAWNAGTINCCCVVGASSVTGNSYVGGLVGYNDIVIISNCYSNSTVTGGNVVGGLVGNNKGNLANCYAYGAVSGTSNTGGLLGRRENDATYPDTWSNCYYNSQTSGQSDTGKGTSLTTTQMMQQSSYNTWDFSTVWNINAGTSYPYLRTAVANPLPGPIVLTIVGSFTAGSKVYDGTAAAAININNLTLNGIKGSDSVTLNSVAVFSDVGAGTGKTVTLTGSTISGANADKYQLSLTSAPTTSTDITRKALTIAGTFAVSNKKYDGTNAATITSNALTLAGGIIGADNVGLNAAATFADANVGTGKTVSLNNSSLSGSAAGNYNLSLTGAPTTTSNITKADAPPSPGTPTLVSKTNTIVTLTPNAVYEFRVNGGTWQDSNVFTGLSPTTTYIFTARVKETANCNPSAESTGLTVTTFAASDFFVGDGSQTNPYQIASVEQLNNVRNYLSYGHYFKLTADIDLNVAPYNTGTGWVPIGTFDTPFQGNFDGNSHIISNLYINNSNLNYAGLFGAVEDLTDVSQLSVTNLGLTNVNITAHACVGGLAGFLGITLVSNCYVTGNITCPGDMQSRFIGGLIGDTDRRTSISYCYASANITNAFSEAGGLIGLADGGSSSIVSQCYAAGNVTLSNASLGGGYRSDFAGGLIGYSRCPVSNCYATGNVTAIWDVGGLEGMTYYNSPVTNCYSTGRVSGQTNTGGLIGNNTYNQVVSSSYYNIDLAGQSDSGKGTAMRTSQFMQPSTFSGWDTSIWNISALKYPGLKASTVNALRGGAFDGKGTGTSADPYQISTPILLDCIRASNASYYTLTNDIDLTSYLSPGGGGYNSGAGWDPVYFNGNFNGNGHTISGLFINLPARVNCGFISDNFGTIKNVVLKNVSVTGSSTVGGLVGYNNGPLTSSCVIGTSTVTANDTLGGLVGYNDIVTISNCYSNTTVTGGSTAGGLVGYNKGTMTDCYSFGAVAGTSNTGGLLGTRQSVTGTVINCYYNSQASGQSDTGKGLPLTISQMQLQASYNSWDFSTVWNINSGSSYPYLRAAVANPLPGPIVLTVGGSFTAASKVYDGTAAAAISTNNLTLIGISGSDQVTLNPVAVFSDASSGTGKSVTLTGSTISGVNSGKYLLSLTGAPTSSADITRKTLTIGGTFTVNNKKYDGTNAATISTNSLALAGIIGADVVNLNATAAFADANVGTGKTVSLTGSSLSGSNAGNYNLSFTGAPTTSANIAKADGPAAPGAPTLVSKTAFTVTLTSNAAYEFRVNGGAWQDSNVFTGLTPGTAYTFTQRVKEIATCNPSAESTGLSVTTNPVYTVTYNPNGGSGTAPTESSKAAGDTFAASNNSFAAPVGKQFVKWNSAADGSGTSYAPGATVTMPAGNLTLYAIWNYITYNVTYNGNGGTGTAPTEGGKIMGATFTAATNTFTASVGKQFVKWNTAADGSGTSYTAGATVTMPAGNLTLYAIWNDIIYTVTYNGNSGTGTAPTEGGKIMGATFTAGTNTLTAPVGKQFVMWNTATDGSGTSYAAGATVTMPAGNLILYAIWNYITYNVTYNGNGGTGTGPTEGEIMGATFTAATNTFTAPLGKQFVKWNTAADGSGTSYAAGATVTMPAGNLILYAIWNDIIYTVTYYVNGGTGTAPIESGKIAGATFPAAANTFTPPSGKQFKEWNLAANGNGTSYPAGATITMSPNNLALYAIWVAAVTVTFDSRGGSAVASITAAPGACITAPDAPTRTGYIFEGWYKDTSCTVEWNFANDKAAGDMTLYAKWAAAPVTFNPTVNNGSITGGRTQFQFDEKITVTANPAQEGKKFAYWTIDGVKVSYSPTYSYYAAGDVNITANYVDVGAAVEKEPAVRLEAKEIQRGYDAGNYSLYYTGQIVVPEGYTLVECGLVMADQRVTSLADLIIGGSVNGSAVKKAVSTAQTSTGQYMIIVNGVPAGKTRVGRAYMIYQHSGATTTIYSSSLLELVTP